MRSMTLRKAKQKGFTLLELLVVITLLAILATGALLAYEGLTDTAQGAAASNNTATADQSIRNYKAVTQNYPDQWDNLVVSGDGASAVPVAATPAGSLPGFFNADVMGGFLATFDLASAGSVAAALENVGIGEIQSRLNGALTTGVEPNLQHNEGAVALVDTDYPTAPDVVEVDTDELQQVAIVPSFGSAACTMAAAVGGAYPTTKLNGDTVAVADSRFLNKINDALEENECHLVVAFGFGNDAAKSTSGSAVAIAAAPTYSSRNINPNTQYARYIGLFHVAADNGANGGTAEDNIIQAGEVFQKARLIAVVDTEGKVIDQNIAAATDTTAN